MAEEPTELNQNSNSKWPLVSSEKPFFLNIFKEVVKENTLFSTLP